jgi:hypothetical protein
VYVKDEIGDCVCKLLKSLHFFRILT